jgi:hypothetical protein
MCSLGGSNVMTHTVKDNLSNNIILAVEEVLSVFGLMMV